jgi:DNA modification methylase
MPESVTDRPTKAHEQIFLLAKSQKYYFDQEAVREPGNDEKTMREIERQSKLRQKGTERGISNDEKVNQVYKWGGDISKFQANGRNIRTVWTVATQPYSEAHFATFPEKLVEPMIKAGCPIGGTVLDPFCGSGTVLRVAERLQRKAVGIDLGYQELAEKRKRFNQIELMV